ncbi:unnamed protein product, partial [Peniophora sp. CBMAI 1063]
GGPGARGEGVGDVREGGLVDAREEALVNAQDDTTANDQEENEVHRTPVATKRGRGTARGRARGTAAATRGGRGRGAAPVAARAPARGGAPVTAARGAATGARGATATATRARRGGGIPRAAPSTVRLTRSSSTRTIDTQESAGSQPTAKDKDKGKEKAPEKEVEQKDEDEVEIVKDVPDAMDVDDEPGSTSVIVKPKTPLKMSVELPAEGSKTPGRAKTPVFARPKTPGVNARSTGSDASSNAALPKRTGGFAAPTASSLSKTQASPTKKPASSIAGPSSSRASSPTKPASSSTTTTRPSLISKSSHSSLSNLNAVLERSRAQTSMGFNRDVQRSTAGTGGGRSREREELPDRLDGSLVAREWGAKGKAGAGKEKEKKLPPGQTTLGLKGSGAGPSKVTGAGPSKLNGAAGPSKANGATANGLKRTASLGALGRGQPSGGMKQATLPFGKPKVPPTAGFPVKRMYASQKSGLATVKGSPVKGGTSAMLEADEDEEEDEEVMNRSMVKGKGKARVPGIEPMDLTSLGESALVDSEDEDPDAPGYSTTIGPVTPASRVHAGWEKNASRRASLASQALLALQAQAQVQSPGTPPESERARSTRSGGALQPNPGPAPQGVPKVLKHCSVYVDVRGPDGDDQGTWFVETLRLLGARVQARLGSACTHIVFRGGGAGTLQRYAQLPDPKPAVVGVGWVVACAEQVRAMGTEGYAVDVAAASAEAVVREKARPAFRRGRKSAVVG